MSKLFQVTLVICLMVASAGLAQKPALKAIQDDIAAAEGNTGYYSETYRKDEERWWVNLPVWMDQDARSRKVGRILDIGCGYGTLLALSSRIYDAKGYCLDVTDYLHAPVRRIYGLDFQKGNIELDPIPWKEPFDVIVMTEVLEHFNFQATPTMKKIHDALAPGGLLFLSTPDESRWGRTTKYYKQLKDLPAPTAGTKIIDDHIWVYSKKELEQLLEASGFKIVKLEYAPGVVGRHFNVMAARAEGEGKAKR